jgi:hypothetical protein
MPNRAAERVVNALNFNWPDSICHGNSQRRLKQWLANAIRDGYTPAEIDRLGAIMDIGPGSCMQWPSTTRGRNLKRLCILIYCVLLYHTFDETEQFKNQVIGWDKAATKRRTRRAMARAIHYAHHRDAWATDVTARCGGNVVRFYNQGDDQRLNLIDYTQQGWCLGMTTEWVIDHVRGDDFWAGHTTRAYERRYQMVMAAQELRIGGVAGSNLRDASKFRMRRAGMTRTDNIVLPRGATAAGMARAIVRAPTSYVITGHARADGTGGHAMAAYKTAGGITFMDPNLGEFSFASMNDFEKWYALFMRFQGYDIDSYQIEGYRVTRMPDRHLAAQLTGAMRQRRRAMGYEDA